MTKTSRSVLWGRLRVSSSRAGVWVQFALALALLASVPARAEYDGDAGLGKEEFTYAKLMSLLEAEKPSTVQDALGVIKRNHPDYFSFYTLVYDSRSLQEASFQSPRAIVFGRDARLVLTFNGDQIGDHHPRASDSIELVRFLEGPKKFEFRQIVFRDDAHPGDPYLSSAPYQVAAPNSTLSQEGTCLLCHGSDPRPNWDAYSTWPGVYGSLDDFNDSALLKGRELPEYLKFKKTMADRGRYSVLAPVSAAPRPNHDLGILLTGLNAQRAMNILLHHPVATARKYGILRSLACMPSVSMRTIDASASPDAPEQTIEAAARPLTPLEEDTDNQIVNNLVYRFERVASLNGIPLRNLFEGFSAFALGQAARVYGLSPDDVVDAYARSLLGLQESLAVASLRRILEPAGIDLANWSLPLGANSYVFDEPSSNRVNLPIQLIFAKPFLAAAFKDPSESWIVTRFTKWIQPKNGTEAPSAERARDCARLMSLDRASLDGVSTRK